MRSPKIVLENLQNLSSRQEYEFERLYRNFYNKEFYLMAYQNIYGNTGSMTAGTDNLTLDGFSDEKVAKIIDSIRNHSYTPNPVRRQYIPKKNGKLRPIGISSANDKLVQEVMRMILESIFEPNFSDNSHGFRPKRSCHTALASVQKRFTGAKWFIEGDIKSYFDTIDHHILIAIIRKRIKDESFIELLWKFLKSGIMDNFIFNATYSGVAQGSGVSPILSNIYLNEFDNYMEEYRNNFNAGTKRNHSKEYHKAHRAFASLNRKLKTIWHTLNDDEKQSAIKQKKELRHQFQSLQTLEPMDDSFKRLHYVRYADDFILGVIGSKADAVKIKSDIKDFLAEKLNLTLSDEKTLITIGKDKARFLGYDIAISQSNQTTKTARGQIRVYKDKVKLYVPKEKWIGKLLDLNVLKINNTNGNKEKWQPISRNSLVNLNPHEILIQYNSEIRGLYKYYKLANNVSVIQKFKYVMEYSLYKTIGAKFRISMPQAKLKYTRNKIFSIPYETKSGIRYVSLYNGGFTRQKMASRFANDLLPQFGSMNQPKELYFRFKACKCELCGAEQISPIVHQVKSLKSLKGVNEIERLMISKRRKTLMLCNNCYQKDTTKL
jgi:group II intron reverse transcriptase/maturase